MVNRIDNWGAALPKEFRSDSLGDMKQLGIKKLFRGIILAPSNAGKTNLCYHIVKNAPNVFSHLHLIARNPDQDLYNYMKEKPAGYITVYVPSTPPSLVIIDDYSSDKKLQKDLFSHYFIRGRQKRLSTLFLTHSWFATDKLTRLNSEYLWILIANSRRDLKMVISDFSLPDLTLEQLIRAYNAATREKGQALLVDNVRSVLRYNFNEKPIYLD
ncbi:hypothetical protein PHYSODRAFT_530638 [Phytophthora sojae]|uniref:Uncharacterized protein n=1 Tax=Phytophthora sojae (strain P6497) TaxID=1094619 RepID=G5ACR9_PHYSP|nr:hypothetical protein PHYSODRAFT_530638 [Phytophthora sojae]EGZ07143.1 hypothetical protein PHYSODRAFT_530638 [Phytophthora sojae]|eukprot:XP_009537907.1 hypothetical protein PHYSODRAFT_530638 [Phytophthora sojae]